VRVVKRRIIRNVVEWQNVRNIVQEVERKRDKDVNGGV